MEAEVVEHFHRVNGTLRTIGPHLSPEALAMVYKASTLAMVASKAQQPSGTAMATAKNMAAMAGESPAKATKVLGLNIPVPVYPEMKQFLGVCKFHGGETAIAPKFQAGTLFKLKRLVSQEKILRVRRLAEEVDVLLKDKC